MKSFRIPTKVCIEPGCIAQLPALVSGLPARRALLVTDAGLADHPALTGTATALRAAGIQCEVDAEVETNPRITTAERLAARARDAEVVIGIGGGSVLDAAKAAAMLATNAGSALDYVGKNLFTTAPLPFIAVPTTCGTGSEVTWVAVLTDAPNATKVSIKGDLMFPDFALVDANLVADLPAHLVASTGLDALTHAIEATTGTQANPVSDALAEKSIELTLRYLPRAVSDIAGDDEARTGVVQAATIAGLAFGNSDVAGVHCLSETLGGMRDVPHGLTNAMLLVPVLRYHLPYITGRLAELERRLAGVTTAQPTGEQFLHRLAGLITTLEIPPFASLGVTADEHAAIAAAAAANGSNASNPQPMAAADYHKILTE